MNEQLQHAHVEKNLFVVAWNYPEVRLQLFTGDPFRNSYLTRIFKALDCKFFNNFVELIRLCTTLQQFLKRLDLSINDKHSSFPFFPLLSTLQEPSLEYGKLFQPRFRNESVAKVHRSIWKTKAFVKQSCCCLCFPFAVSLCNACWRYEYRKSHRFQQFIKHHLPCHQLQ